jgi:VWFA-related protein
MTSFRLSCLAALALSCLSLSGAAQQPAQQPGQQPSSGAAGLGASAPAPAPGAAGQNAATGSDQPAPTLQVQAREVLLPVTVRDKKGALVTNLTASDFTLTEDGRSQTIKSFSVQSNLPFLLGLLVDTSRSVDSAMDSERKAAEKFVGLMLPEDSKAAKQGDEAFLLYFDHEVELLEDFTNSRDKLDREIDEMGPSTAEHNNPQGPETGDESNQRGAHGGGTQLYDAIYLASDDLMKPKEGRKALIVFSDGVDRGSKETMGEALDAADHANVSVYTIYFKGEAERDQNGFPGGRHGGMGGGGYPGGWPGGGGGYPGGGRRGGNESQVDGFKIMQQIATRTGARYFEAKKKDSLEDIYNQIAEELRGQYLLSYTPDQVDNDGGYHKIALKAKNADLTVITREGYFAPGGDSK